MVHSMSYGGNERRPLSIYSWEQGGPGIDLESLPTVRALMQVSREARKAVLAGRQFQRLLHNNARVYSYKYWLCVLRNCFFVNWEIDMFYFLDQRPLVKLCYSLIDSNWVTFPNSWVAKIQRAAIGFDGVFNPANNLLDASYDELFNQTAIEHLAVIPSLKTVYLALDRLLSAQLYGRTLYTEEFRAAIDAALIDATKRRAAQIKAANMNGDSDTPMSEGEDNNSTNIIHVNDNDFGDIDIRDIRTIRTNSGIWAFSTAPVRGLPTDRWGFHHIGASSKLDSRKAIVTVGPQGSQPTQRIEVPILDYFYQLVSRVKEDAERAGKPAVDVQMVMSLG